MDVAKERGNECFRKKDFEGALTEYSKAIVEFQKDQRRNPETFSAILINAAASSLELKKDYEDVRRWCSDAQLLLSDDELAGSFDKTRRPQLLAKALYRRALASYRLEQYRQCEEDLLEATKLDNLPRQLATTITTLLQEARISADACEAEADLEDDELPPLEDMSIHLGSVSKSVEQRKAQQEQVKEEWNRKQQTSLRSGFLTEEAQKEKLVSSSLKMTSSDTDSSNVPQKVEGKSNDAMGRMQDEIQTGLKDQAGSAEWVTPDLMQTIMNDPKLVQLLVKPHIRKVVDALTSGNMPAMKEIMREHGDDEEVNYVFKKMCGVLGEHFTQLDEKEEESKPSAAPITPSQQLPTNTNGVPQSAIEDAIADPMIRRLIDALKSGVRVKAQEALFFVQQRPDLRQKLDVLIKSGMLQMQYS